MIRYAKLPIRYNLNGIQQELSALNREWQEHFNTHYYEGSWKVLALRSPGGGDKNIIPDLITDNDYLDTAYMQYFPSVKALLSTFNCPVMAVRFLNLQAGAVIKPHRDHELAFEKGEARLHFPVITNPQVSFNIENERIPLQEGDCWYINANLTHGVANLGTADRVHLVVDCKVNNWIKHLMSLATEVSHSTDNGNLPDIIRELRMQNTDTSNKLASQLEQQLLARNTFTQAN
ncbi:MAG: aspartyl/asparaginyl beta-hydroxylase domain-containing protein [Mucilaginibacter sp.]|uniref:aspartyl/asparaginyl beta-hydroxylase domain-containing protein n=1 Tax=Mucilaginibacter sp. TaxID=1882438 RepID=UPI0031B4172E